MTDFPAFPPDPPEEPAPLMLPCARCGELVKLQRWAWDLVVVANSMLEAKGNDIMGPGEMAYHDSCYAEHRDEVRAAGVKEALDDRKLWRRFVAHNVTEAALRSGINDRSTYIGKKLKAYNKSAAKSQATGRPRGT